MILGREPSREERLVRRLSQLDWLRGQAQEEDGEEADTRDGEQAKARKEAAALPASTMRFEEAGRHLVEAHDELSHLLRLLETLGASSSRGGTAAGAGLLQLSRIPRGEVGLGAEVRELACRVQGKQRELQRAADCLAAAARHVRERAAQQQTLLDRLRALRQRWRLRSSRESPLALAVEAGRDEAGAPLLLPLLPADAPQLLAVPDAPALRLQLAPPERPALELPGERTSDPLEAAIARAWRTARSRALFERLRGEALSAGPYLQLHEDYLLLLVPGRPDLPLAVRLAPAAAAATAATAVEPLPEALLVKALELRLQEGMGLRELACVWERVQQLERLRERVAALVRALPSLRVHWWASAELLPVLEARLVAPSAWPLLFARALPTEQAAARLLPSLQMRVARALLSTLAREIDPALPPYRAVAAAASSSLLVPRLGGRLEIEILPELDDKEAGQEKREAASGGEDAWPLPVLRLDLDLDAREPVRASLRLPLADLLTHPPPLLPLLEHRLSALAKSF
jgi:hypothetical protein